MIKGILGSDVGQPGIRAGDTRVSHISLNGECGTPCYHQLVFLIVSHPQMVYLYYDITKMLLISLLDRSFFRIVAKI